MATGIEMITAERERQVELGWTSQHDDGHDSGELGWAAACYAAPSGIMRRALFADGHPEAHLRAWPWVDYDSPKPALSIQLRIRALAKAGALASAEIDRLLRLEGVPGGE